MGGVMAHNGTFIEALLGFVVLCIFPLLPYFSCLVSNKILQSKDKFISGFLCLIVFFFITLYYFLLFLFLKDMESVIFLIATIIFIVVFVVTYKKTSKGNQSETSTK
ncbi:hypothetical protein [Helicobacter pullorum]|uniref:hypothetical protein n=1 Tax=Helicobacter pullorum TaxID=35818 RepID=UPI001F3C968A|nr:hypothetical protein [Helicobacter pullorum]